MFVIVDGYNIDVTTTLVCDRKKPFFSHLYSHGIVSAHSHSHHRQHFISFTPAQIHITHAIFHARMMSLESSLCIFLFALILIYFFIYFSFVYQGAKILDRKLSCDASHPVTDD
jgi:hypothetical protein